MTLTPDIRYLRHFTSHTFLSCHCTLLHATLYSTPLQPTPLHPSSFYSTPLHSTPPHSTSPFLTPLHHTPRISITPHSTPPNPTLSLLYSTPPWRPHQSMRFFRHNLPSSYPHGITSSPCVRSCLVFSLCYQLSCQWSHCRSLEPANGCSKVIHCLVPFVYHWPGHALHQTLDPRKPGNDGIRLIIY